MAHNCWECDEVCYCDMDDTWGLPQPKDCDHVCREWEGFDEEDEAYDNWKDRQG